MQHGGWTADDDIVQSKPKVILQLSARSEAAWQYDVERRQELKVSCNNYQVLEIRIFAALGLGSGR